MSPSEEKVSDTCSDDEGATYVHVVRHNHQHQHVPVKDENSSISPLTTLFVVRADINFRLPEIKIFSHTQNQFDRTVF